MRVQRVGTVFRIERLLNVCGAVLLLAGALVGWALPHSARAWALLPGLGTTVAATRPDVSGYLGADITALAVIIAVVIGFNATALQIAGQTHALGIVRGILLSLMPFLFCWGATTGVALLYFLEPPIYFAQLWQMLFWFAAVVLLMLAYLWGLPWRLSGSYVTAWAIRELRGRPSDRWETLDAFSALQSAIAAASARGDLGTLRVLTADLGGFLAGRDDPRVEQEPAYQRERYRALKNLLSGCAQNGTAGPNPVAYQLGFVLAGVMLRAVATGQPLADPERDFYSGLFRGLRGAPERLDALWTGMRHALLRSGTHGSPYLLRYWRARRQWGTAEPRTVTRLAGGIARLHADCRRQLASTAGEAVALEDATTMLLDLYRDIALHLAKAAAHQRQRSIRERDLTLTTALLDAIRDEVARTWPLGADTPHYERLAAAYERRHAEIDALTVGRHDEEREAVGTARPLA
ncbi:MAG: hypothetical protein IVW57_00785 [Ktedonobacterales bacterium]|nr:hypothetical protein [Ktedonobacterales bacterium]